ncbi:MAG: hypothetical protein MIO87_05525, partial [Methanomassiliicoccales archaeon]|nr:hypothetical protein [Methanomassiliicoccales archaeon]
MQRQPASSLDLFTDSIRLMGDATIVSILVFDRYLDHERLCLAVSRCFDAFPILSSKLFRGHGPAFWELQDRSEGFSKVPVVGIGPNDYRPFVAQGMDPHEAPQAVFRILRSPERDVLVINMAHAAADGYGMKELSRTLMNAYIDPASVPVGDGILPARDTSWTAELLDEDDQVKKEDIRLINSMWPRPCGPSQAPSTYHRAIISPEGIGAIKREAKAHGGTINDVIMAAYFLSLSDLTEHMGPQEISYPVNLRRYLVDGSRAISNQSANVRFQLTREPGERMCQILDKVIKETTRLKLDRIGIGDQVKFDRGSDAEGRAVHEMVRSMVRLQENGSANIFITNPGPMTLPPVAGLVDAYICYPGMRMPATCFIIS